MRLHGGEPSAALLSTAREGFLPSARAHALEKSVHAQTPPVRLWSQVFLHSCGCRPPVRCRLVSVLLYGLSKAESRQNCAACGGVACDAGASSATVCSRRVRSRESMRAWICRLRVLARFAIMPSDFYAAFHDSARSFGIPAWGRRFLCQSRCVFLRDDVVFMSARDQPAGLALCKRCGKRVTYAV